MVAKEERKKKKKRLMINMALNQIIVYSVFAEGLCASGWQFQLRFQLWICDPSLGGQTEPAAHPRLRGPPTVLFACG